MSWPVVWSIPACRASTAPERVGSITKQAVSGPRNTHSHHFTGPATAPLPSGVFSRGVNTRQPVSSACRCHEPRDRATIATSSGASSSPAAAQVPVSVAADRSAPCRARPMTSEFCERPATYRSVSRCAMNALETRPLPIAGGGGAVRGGARRAKCTHGQHLAEFGDLLALLLHQRRQPLVRLKRMGQQTLQADERVRFRECTASCHERQQTPPRSEDHASPAPGVSHREATPMPGADHTTSDHLRRNNTGFSRIPSRLAHRARPIRQYWTDATLSRLLLPSPAIPGSSYLQLHPTATTRRRWRSFTPIRNTRASWRTINFCRLRTRSGPPPAMPRRSVAAAAVRLLAVAPMHGVPVGGLVLGSVHHRHVAATAVVSAWSWCPTCPFGSGVVEH